MLIISNRLIVLLQLSQINQYFQYPHYIQLIIITIIIANTYTKQMKSNDYQQDEQQSLRNQQSKQHVPATQANNGIPKCYVIFLVIASIMFVTTLGVNVYMMVMRVRDSGGSRPGDVGGGELVARVVLDDIEYEKPMGYVRSVVQQYNASKYENDDEDDLSPIPVNTTQRISYGAPGPLLPKMRIVTISKPNPPQSSNLCLITNGIDVITNTSIHTASTLLSQPQFHKWVIILDQIDGYSDGLWMDFVQDSKSRGVQYEYLDKNVTVDADYQFITSAVSGCKLITYIQHYFHISQQQSTLLINLITQTQQQHNQHQHYLLYPTTTLTKNKITTLPNLNNTALSQISSRQLNKYMFVFSVEFLYLITPVNYAYYGQYTVEELLVRPILGIVWGSAGMVGVGGGVVYGFDVAYGSSKQFAIKQVGRVADRNGRRNRNNVKSPTCFVSYPVIPTQIKYQQLQQYFHSLINITGIQNSTIIINIPHISPLIYATYTLLSPYSQQYNIRLRIATNKTASSLAVYEAAYCYCQQSAIIVSSRHNVVFYGDFLGQLLAGFVVKYHYYFVAFQRSQANGDTTIVNISVPFKYYKRKFRQEMTNFQSHFMQLQIFKSDLFRMMYFWSLKCDEVDFYLTQASFVIPLLQMVRLSTGIITKPLYRVQGRVISQVEKQQMDSLRLYYQWSPIPFNKLYPIAFNSLENVAFKRYPRQKIPKIIHQIWLGKKQITPFQLKLQQSLIEVNKDFQVLLWKDQNITTQIFPLTYALIHRIIQYQRYSNRSYSAPTASLIRYELLYRLGGIYIDFKTEGKKPLNPFLKYELFFIDIDYGINHYIYPKNVGNGIMGARKNNYHLLLTLTQLISEQKFNFKAFDFPKIVGGYVLRKALTNNQLFTEVGYGFQLFSQKPGTGKPNLCSISEGPPDPDQQKFKVTDFLTGKVFTIMLPCKHYKQAYLIMYKVLAGTWKTKKVFQPGNTFLRNIHNKLQNTNNK